jgi:hypothetical protein
MYLPGRAELLFSILFFNVGPSAPAAALSWKINKFEAHLPGCESHPAQRCASVDLSYPEILSGPKSGRKEIAAAIQDMLLTPLEKGKAPSTPDEFSKQILSHYQSWLRQGGDPRISWLVQRKIDVDFSSPKVFCVRLAERVEQGKERAAKNTVYFNFRPEDGTLIQLTDLIRADRFAEFKQIASKHFRNKDEKVHAGEDAKLPGEEFALPKNYAIERDGLRFRYEEDQVDIHSIRTPEFVVPYREFADLMKPGVTLPG